MEMDIDLFPGVRGGGSLGIVIKKSRSREVQFAVLRHPIPVQTPMERFGLELAAFRGQPRHLGVEHHFVIHAHIDLDMWMMRSSFEIPRVDERQPQPLEVFHVARDERQLVFERRRGDQPVRHSKRTSRQPPGSINQTPSVSHGLSDGMNPVREQRNQDTVKPRGQSLATNRIRMGCASSTKLTHGDDTQVQRRIILRMNDHADRAREAGCVSFLTKPDAVMYPLAKAPVEEMRMKGFVWNAAARPKDRNSIFAPAE